MKNYFHTEDDISYSKNSKLYKLYKCTRETPEVIHTLSKDIELPNELKFCVPTLPSLKKLNDAIIEAKRKLAWNLYFKTQNKCTELSKFDKWRINVKKNNNQSNNTPKIHCPQESLIFPSNLNFTTQIKGHTKNQIL